MERILKAPEGVGVKKEGNSLMVKGPKGELKRDFFSHNVKMDVKGDTVRVSSVNDKKKTGAVLGTWGAHVGNMFRGVSTGWRSEMKLVYAHFPVKLNVEGNKLLISNFLGERSDREALIMDGVKADVKKDEIILTGIDKEKVGQTAANIENACKVRGRDRRVFSDGVWITRKAYQEEGNE